jgi:hypothetical protein
VSIARALWFVSLFGILPHSVSAQLRSRIAGCYRFDRPYFAWFLTDSSTRRMRPESTAVIRLLDDSVVTVFGRRARAVLPIPAPADTVERRRWLRVSNWTEFPSGAIRVEWRDGFHGPIFLLKTTRGALAGEVVQTTDAYVIGVPRPVAEPAHAVRIDCP